MHRIEVEQAVLLDLPRAAGLAALVVPHDGAHRDDRIEAHLRVPEELHLPIVPKALHITLHGVERGSAVRATAAEGLPYTFHMLVYDVGGEMLCKQVGGVLRPQNLLVRNSPRRPHLLHPKPLGCGDA